MAATTPDINTAAQELQQGFTSLNGFGHMIADAYALPGAPYVAPLLLLAILVVATYVKTQNTAVTVAVSTLFIALWSEIFSTTGGMRFVQILMGLFVLGATYLVVRVVMRNE